MIVATKWDTTHFSSSLHLKIALGWYRCGILFQTRRYLRTTVDGTGLEKLHQSYLPNF